MEVQIRYLRLFLALALLACPPIPGLQAQTAVTAAEGNTPGGGGTFSYTVGHIFYTTISSVNHSFAQGVQQPYEISVLTGTEKAGDISLNIILYLNPASDIICLKTGDYETNRLRYRLYGINGRLLLTRKVDDDEIPIAIGHPNPAA